ncbi:hypothetical protein [Aquimarina sp. RZ0]|uniref:hypothetical protein n=1 Tax=Aquimarina sp. RZ0 TaxID=2607730 RepID=UPI0011F3AF42|nr:hypothetical protein [Aquimarina sp. RZ0]KAA1242591.1 hypothetical protein F0000_24905 [Aquimarina sp. RZ0]
MNTQDPSERYHHGKILKDYIIKNNLNRKGGMNRLALALHMSRQGVYGLYKQEVIKHYNRQAIIEYFDLPDDFFPNPDEKEDEYNLMFREYVNAKMKIEQLEDDLNKAQARYTTRLVMDNLVYDPENKECHNVHVIMGPNTENYVQHYFDPLYLDRLTKMIIPNLQGAFAFEVGDIGMAEVGGLPGSLALSNDLIEFYENIEENTPYIIVYNSLKYGSGICCRYVSYFRRKFRLFSPNKSISDIELSQFEVEQIWEVKQFLELPEEQYRKFLEDSVEDDFR